MTATQKSTDDTQTRNAGAESLFASMHLLEESGADVEFTMPCEQRLVIRRQGVTYSVRQLSKGRNSYRYSVSVDLNGEHTPPMKYDNAYKAFDEAVDMVYKMILADPRQDAIGRL